MTPTWIAAAVAISFVQTAQAWHLYKMVNWLAALQWTLLPSLMAVVMLVLLLWTGTSVWGFTVAGGAGFAAQLAGERVQAKRRAQQEASS